MRVLAASDRVVPVGELRALLDEIDTDVVLTCLCGTEDRWIQLDLTHREEGPPGYPEDIGVALVERYPFARREDATRLVEQLLSGEDGEDHPPASAAAWVRREAEAVRVEYLFRVHAVLSRDEQASAAVEAVLGLLHIELGGLAYAEQQGFSLTVDDADWQITWHPAMSRSRPQDWRRMAVLDGEDWVLFVMDAGDPSHRAAFCRGEVPAGIVPVARRTAALCPRPLE